MADCLLWFVVVAQGIAVVRLIACLGRCECELRELRQRHAAPLTRFYAGRDTHRLN